MPPTDAAIGEIASHANIGYLADVVWLLFAGVAAVTLFGRLRLSPVLGYLCAGAAIGGYGMELVAPDDFAFIAEFGVVFLLFMIGLELTLERLIEMRRYLFGMGTLQMIVTSAAIALLCRYLAGFNVAQSVVVGSALALSSTAVALRVLTDGKQQSSQAGRISIAILILQDLAVIPLLVLLPKAGESLAHIVPAMGRALSEAAAAIVAIFIAGRLLMRPLFNKIAENNELFVIAILLVILGSSFAAVYAGLSLAMGAFVAGILIAGTRHQHRVSEFVGPFKDVLMGLFFMTVGMTIDVKLLQDHIGVVLMLAASLLLVKAVVLTCVCRLFRLPWESSLRIGMLLAQGGEFAFILFRMASQPHIKLLTDVQSQMLFFVVTISMAVTPLLPALGRVIVRRLHLRDMPSQARHAGKCADVADLNRHILIVGFGRTGQMAARLLQKQGIPYVAVDNSAVTVRNLRQEGYPVYLGSCLDSETLEHLGIARCRAVIVCVPNDGRLLRLVRHVSSSYPGLPVVARVADLAQGKEAVDNGASVVVSEKNESGLQLAAVVLNALGMPPHEVSRLKNEFRAGGYKDPQEHCPIVLPSID
jgi:CPA2 family monovalent cation:H+ antiporter-2